MRQLNSEASVRRRDLQWTEKWRPRRADEVLGNEERAMYLRDWLVALRLQYDGPKTNAKGKSKSNGDYGTGTEVGSRDGEGITASGGSGVIASGSSASQKRKRKVGKVKKPTVIRQVKKRRRIDYDDLDGFVAADDEIEDFEDSMAISDDDLVEFFQNQASSSASQSAASTPPSSYPSSPPPVDVEDEDEDVPVTQLFQSKKPVKFGQSIHNTILLAGPHGSGKTAAVYACADELGWEVFEVYPGIGQRCGPELHRLVGDVGKHHLVNTKRSDHNNSDGQTAQPLFQSAPSGTGRKPARQIVLSDNDDDDDQEVDVTSTLDAPIPLVSITQRDEPEIKQSLILIEEVDVLYQCDTGFWQALIAIIKECRRPVVLTCNGMFQHNIFGSSHITKWCV